MKDSLMAVNSDKVTKWKTDTVASVDFYNKWFLRFAPKAYRETRQETTKQVTAALQATNNMRDISAEVLRSNPHVLPTLRMATAPPLAVDRLIGLACVPGNLVKTMNTNGKIPPRMSEADLKRGLESIGVMLESLADKGIFTWLETAKTPGEEELYRAATIVADRLCGAMANPIIRNAQETRQLAAIKEWLESRSYTHLATGQGTKADSMKPGTFCFHLNVVVRQKNGRPVNIPVDVAIMPKKEKTCTMPLLIEAKSAGDFTNTNKRRKEEAEKVRGLRSTYGQDIGFILFLCGYFDAGYLGYEAAEGIDWVWEHRIDDLAKFGL
jgi:hypothetical protein